MPFGNNGEAIWNEIQQSPYERTHFNMQSTQRQGSSLTQYLYVKYYLLIIQTGLIEGGTHWSMFSNVVSKITEKAGPFMVASSSMTKSKVKHVYMASVTCPNSTWKFTDPSPRLPPDSSPLWQQCGSKWVMDSRKLPSQIARFTGPTWGPPGADRI